MFTLTQCLVDRQETGWHRGRIIIISLPFGLRDKVSYAVRFIALSGSVSIQFRDLRTRNDIALYFLTLDGG